jgi:hypothetical protein
MPPAIKQSSTARRKRLAEYIELHGKVKTRRCLKIVLSIAESVMFTLVPLAVASAIGAD